MAIERNVTTSGDFIDAPGEYQVTVQAATLGASKYGKDMLTVILETDDGRTIRSFFIKGSKAQMENLEKLKNACGLQLDCPADILFERGDAFVGCRLGIAVDAGKPNKEGRVFMQVVGYGPADKVEAHDEVPF